MSRVKVINQALIKEGFVKTKKMGTASSNTSQTQAYFWLQNPASLKTKLIDA